MKLRPMESTDVGAAEEVWADAFTTMRVSHSLPIDPRTAESIARMHSRMAHLLHTDPEGSWVAQDESGKVVGFTQALVRDKFWVLALLGVSPGCQEQGTGTSLLNTALAYGSRELPGMIMASRDPRAMRAYSRAGFDLQPAVAARGQVSTHRLARAARVRDGRSRDYEFMGALDRRARGSDRRVDIEYLLDNGCRLLVIEGEGFIVAGGGRPMMLSADNEQAAVDLLSACFAEADPNEVIEVSWITAAQQWAITVALDAGLTLQPTGPLMTRGMASPPPYYMPSGMHG